MSRSGRIAQAQRMARAGPSKVAKKPSPASSTSVPHNRSRSHVSNIFTKLQVADRDQGIIKARDAGLGITANRRT
jgi:hypothetical protein